jgi:nucleotide-binding universal stress UspA family protein
MRTPRISIQRIVVPFDGEPEHERAIAIAEDIAAQVGVQVELLSVLKTGAAAHEAIEVKRVAAHAGQSTRVISSNTVVGSLMNVDHEPDTLICLASSGHTAVTETLGSGITAELLCRLDRPVVVVGPRCDAALRGEVLAILIDGSADGERIVPDALDLADQLGLVPRFFRVLRDPESTSGHSSAYMEALVARYESDDRPIEYQVLADPKPRRALAELVGKATVAMVAVASDGLEPRQRLLQRSITHHIIRRAHCPVLVGSRRAKVGPGPRDD